MCTELISGDRNFTLTASVPSNTEIDYYTLLLTVPFACDKYVYSLIAVFSWSDSHVQINVFIRRNKCEQPKSGIYIFGMPLIAEKVVPDTFRLYL